MVTMQPEEKTRIKRQREEQAIQLAMQSRWEEAASVNQSIIELFPADVDSYNRLGKALNELGRYSAARSAYARALELDPANTIARKNHQRLAALKEAAGPAEAPAAKVDPRLFIEERGKTAIAILQRPAPRETMARVNAGDQVGLRQRGRSIVVETVGGEYLGMIEPKLGLRVIKMMEGGNKYAAAVTSVQDSSARVIIKEIF
jgi:tetratricopeptide (TPR) repeat protein